MIPRRKIFEARRFKTWAEAYNFKYDIQEESNRKKTCIITGDDVKGFTARVVCARKCPN